MFSENVWEIQYSHSVSQPIFFSPKVAILCKNPFIRKFPISLSEKNWHPALPVKQCLALSVVSPSVKSLHSAFNL